jgi:HEPN domain-containing protein
MRRLVALGDVTVGPQGRRVDDRTEAYDISMLAEDSYVSAALRHADDARTLHASGAYDNAVYIGGYSVETLLKGWIHAEAGVAVRTHSLIRLETIALAATVHRVDRRSIFPSEAIARARALRWTPETRYWQSGRRSGGESRALMHVLDNLVHDTVRPLILDGTLRL